MSTNPLEGYLNILQRLPKSYISFLENESVHAINGLSLFAPGENGDMEDMLILLQAMRPDLPPIYVPIRLMDNRFLCLSVPEKGTRVEDSPLFEIKMEGVDVPKKIHPSFKKYYIDGKQFEKRRNGALRRIRWHLENAKRRGKKYDHQHGGALPRSKDWRPVRSCVHDLVVGLAAIRHDESFNGLDVDVFLCTDHPNYEPGHGVRALASLLLSDAYRNGATMAIRFTRYDGRKRTRVPERIPRDLVGLAEQLGVNLARSQDGIITHDESLELYSLLVGLSSAVKRGIEPHIARGAFSLAGLCFLISSKVWSLEEASWILLNAPRPEGVLFGIDKPEDRLNYLDSIYYGRAALLARHLHQRLISNSGQAGEGCLVEIAGLAWTYRPAHPVSLDWNVRDSVLNLSANEAVVVFPNPHPLLPQEEKRIVEDITHLYGVSSQSTQKFILYGAEVQRVPSVKKLAEIAEQKAGIQLLSAPFSCSELDQEVERRMARARMVRK